MVQEVWKGGTLTRGIYLCSVFRQKGKDRELFLYLLLLSCLQLKLIHVPKQCLLGQHIMLLFTVNQQKDKVLSLEIAGEFILCQVPCYLQTLTWLTLPITSQGRFCYDSNTHLRAEESETSKVANQPTNRIWTQPHWTEVPGAPATDFPTDVTNNRKELLGKVQRQRQSAAINCFFLLFLLLYVGFHQSIQLKGIRPVLGFSTPILISETDRQKMAPQGKRT